MKIGREIPLSEPDQSLEGQDASAHQPIDCHLRREWVGANM